MINANKETENLRFFQMLSRPGSHTGTVLHVAGLSNPTALAFLLSRVDQSSFAELSHLIVTPDDDTAQEIALDLSVFNTQARIRVLDSFDVSPQSGLPPSPKMGARRAGWLSRALYSKPGEVFIASVGALAQVTAPKEIIKKHTRWIKKGTVFGSKEVRELRDIGYLDCPRVEAPGETSSRGGILDLYSPAELFPIRIELFGDTIESMRYFDPETQRSLEGIDSFLLSPARETLYAESSPEHILQKLTLEDNDSIKQDIARSRIFPGIEFLLPHFYDSLGWPKDFFGPTFAVWRHDSISATAALDNIFSELRDDSRALYTNDALPRPESVSLTLDFNKLQIERVDDEQSLDYKVTDNAELRTAVRAKSDRGEDYVLEAGTRIKTMLASHNNVQVFAHTQSQAQRLAYLLEKAGVTDVPVLEMPITHSVRLWEESLIFLTEDDFLTKSERKRDSRTSNIQRLPDIAFGDLTPGDYVVHIQHGVGQFDGLKRMSLQGVESEFLQLTYKDKDKLYLPVYRIGQIQKYSGIPALDKLGGTGWQKTKIKVKSHLRDLANELLELYAKRSQIKRPPLGEPDDLYKQFESTFPYDETTDQLNSINAVLDDFQEDHPMDRLVCGDVGFGKTEVALRAAFKVAQSGKQVAVLVPTTVLAFQHLETFKSRLKGFPVRVEGFSRFTPKSDLKKNLLALKEGSIDIAIGTHRLLSKDVAFKNLGLMIVDEEQKFGVAHKEKIKKVKIGVDTLSMSATPIPRTMNMSLMGIRDLSIINTAPKDRMPIRTFVCKFDEQTIRKAILNEIQRGGQVFYVHNRVQSIYGLADELRALVPEARIRVGHGQMDESELEDVMVAFYKHEFDVLLSTTIIESGMDIPRANTMVVDRADTFGLSQLYQLRGRIGRSKERAYCYLLIPKQGVLDKDAQERLRILQENTTLGSGFRIAHHDLELRGAGNLLGEEQSGHVNAVGYELYLELLEDALKTAKGEEIEDIEVEPELNLKIPALIPDEYIPDIRSRLQIYKELSRISSPDDIDPIEESLRDQYGPLPDKVTNLFGIMLVRRAAKDLGIRDVSAGTKSLSIAFTEKTKVEPQVVVGLAMREKSKYTLTPDNRLVVKMENLGWPQVHDELMKLKKLARLD